MSGSERVNIHEMTRKKWKAWSRRVVWNHGCHGSKPSRAVLVQAKLALRFQIPSKASLHGIVKSHPPLASRMALLGRWAAEDW